jgi:predicted Zn-dependent protease
MQKYGVRDVQRLVGLARSTVRALVGAGFASPGRGARRTWLFTFQDLIVLRAAQALVAARVPSRRITRSLKELRRHLPEAMPLSGLSICAVGDRVVVREGASAWQAESGQYLLGFEGDPVNGSLSVIERPQPATPAGGWFEKALALESASPAAALLAYERAVEADPAHLDAHINLGRLLHEAGRLADAERVYRGALATCGNDAVLLYNLGVLLDDLDRQDEARDAYEMALQGDPGFADCHYNLSLVYEALERPRDALRHMAQYRRLTGKHR